MLIRLVINNYRIGYIGEPLYCVSDGTHQRMTNSARDQSIEYLERRMKVIRKHESFFGDFWTRFHVAGTLLSYLWCRSDKGLQLRYATRRCGLWPVVLVLVEKVSRKLKAMVGRA